MHFDVQKRQLFCRISLRISHSCPQAGARHVANWRGEASQSGLDSMCVCVTETQQNNTSVKATHPSGVTVAAQEVFTPQHDGITLTLFIYDIVPPGA